MIDPSSHHGRSGHQTDDHSRASEWRRDWQLISCGLAVVLLLLAVEEKWGDNGYGYQDGIYTLQEPFFRFLHIYVTGLALFLAYRFWRQERAIWLIVATSLAILFNPVVPIEIETWAVYYLIAAGGFAYVATLSPSIKAVKSKWKGTSTGSIANSALGSEPSKTLATHGIDLEWPDAVGFDDSVPEERTKPDPFDSWPRWLRWALLITVLIAGALLLKPVGEIGGSIAGAVGAGGLVFLVGWPLFKLGTLLVPREKRPSDGGELIGRLEEIARNTKVSEAHRDEARRRLMEMRTSDH